TSAELRNVRRELEQIARSAADRIARLRQDGEQLKRLQTDERPRQKSSGLRETRVASSAGRGDDSAEGPAEAGGADEDGGGIGGACNDAKTDDAASTPSTTPNGQPRGGTCAGAPPRTGQRRRC